MDTYTNAEEDRYQVIRSTIEGDLTNQEAAKRLGLTKRQVQKIKSRVKEEGKAGIRHGLSGGVSNNALRATTTKKVVVFIKKKLHHDFGPTFTQEQLVKKGIVLSTETIRTIMTKESQWKPRQRRGPQIKRAWRERMASFGELVQFDGSYHHWLENGEEQCLLAAIDDSTSTIVQAVFEENEGVFACFRFWQQYLKIYGRPVAIYLDKFSTYKINHKSAEDNVALLTQFQRAMQELDIKVICAHSPEAKGRVERLFGTLQDRLVKELRLVGIKTTETANQFIATTYRHDHNQRFAVAPRQLEDRHRPLTSLMKKELLSIFSIHSHRIVNNDYTIQFKTEWFQLTATQDTTVYKRDSVTMEERLDGTIHIRHQGGYLSYTRLPLRPKTRRMTVTALTRERPTWKPGPDHPWKTFKK